MASEPSVKALEPGLYLYYGKAVISMSWMTECLALFKQENVCVRKLLLYPDFLDASGNIRYFHLECRFSESNTANFRDKLSLHFSKIQWA